MNSLQQLLALAMPNLPGILLVAIVTVIVATAISVVLLASPRGGSAYDRIGAGGISRESDFVEPTLNSESPAARAEREREIRQMLSARSERLVRAGKPPLDIESELARLVADPQPGGAPDPELLAEVRQLVLARNERRVRAGQEPLDVELEVRRTLAELDR